MSKIELDKLTHELIRRNLVDSCDLDQSDFDREDEIECLLMDDHWEVLKGAWERAAQFRRAKGIRSEQ